MASSARRIVLSLLTLGLVLGGGARSARAQAPLTQLRFDIVGVRLVVDPPALTVPKNIPTQINTSLVVPPGAPADVRDALATLTAGAVVEAELRGPSIPPTKITVVPGSPIPVPAFALPGDYFLDGIRLAKDGVTILDATAADGQAATTIPIKVISEVFVTSVTSRPLSLDEIRQKGIVIDASSFNTVNFQVAFNIDGQKFTIDMPAVLPTPQLLQTTSDRTALIKQVGLINQRLAETQTTLPPEFDRPGINFSIAALPFFFVPEEDGGIPALSVPPITGLVVVAGNVAFLHQFFKVAVMVNNVAPDGSALTLRDVTGTIALPTGLDRVAGTTDQPGDDPLRLARLDGVGVAGAVPIVQTGPDGLVGTADDIAAIPPQKPAEGEFLVEGLKEGGHTFDVEIAATLDGLPSGPVKMTGHAAGAVFVRNPTFAVALAHPRTIRSGESYQLYATVTNTSRSVANLVSVNLDPLSISGAQLTSVPSVTFESIAPGQSATAPFTLVAQRTGEVTFSSLTGDAAVGGGITLFTGIGERGVPLAPNAIVLPASVDALPSSLIAAAQRVLGQAFSIATAPADALPSNVTFVKRQTVIDRGIELAQAGERVRFGEPVGRVITDLLLDWLGNDGFDPGFDELLRETAAGAAFLHEVELIVAAGLAPGAALEYQGTFSQVAVAREHGHLTAVAAAPGGGSAPAIAIGRADGATLTAGGTGANTLPGSALLHPTDAVSLAVLGDAQPLDHAIEFTASAAGVYDLGVVVPAAQPGAARQLRFPAVTLSAGGIARIVVHVPDSGTSSLLIDANGDGSIDDTRQAQPVDLSDATPHVLAVRQLESSFGDAPGDPLDPATYGLLLGVLFDKPVTRASAEAKSAYTLDGNAVIGAAQQHSGRLVYLYLEKPVGGLKPRTLQVNGVTDLRGGVLSPSSQPIVMVLTDGGHVFGQVREAGGRPVPDALLRLTVVIDATHSFDVATIQVDGSGSFDFDFIPRIGQHFTLTAQHPRTRDLASLAARIRGAGEDLLLNPTFAGLGTVNGRLLATDGVTTLPNVPVALIPGSVLGARGFTVRTNELGEFLFTDVPVGIFTVTASDGQRGFGQRQGLIPSAGQSVVLDLPLVAQPDEGGRLVGRVFLGDGFTPARGFTVYVGSYQRDKGTIAAVDTTTTDNDGTFAFARTLPVNGYDVVAVDTAAQQIGSTRASVQAQLTTSVSIVLEATGAVEGVVFNAQGQPVAGAVIAGGLALGTSDANGFFRIEGVPAGSRTIEAGDPVTKRRGSAQVTLIPGQTVRASITLEARATITGRVLDVNGAPMAHVSVRIPEVGGYTFVFTNNQGVYTFPDMRLGTYLIQAPGPSVDSLVSFMEASGMDPLTAFTSGDPTPGIGSAPTPNAGDANSVLAAYQRAVQAFFTVDESPLGLAMASVGGFGWNRVQLFQDSTTVVADIKFLSQGRVAGHTEDGNQRPTGALVRVVGLAVSLTGAPTLAELGRMTSDAATGAFSFSGIPRFDLAMFQSAGVRGGDFTLDAAQPFSPTILSFRDQLNTTNPDLTNIVLRFPSATVTNGTLSGRVFMPDGSTAAPAGTQVQISFGDLTVQVGTDGTFRSLLPIPAGNYTVTAVAANGLRGQAAAAVPAGGEGSVDIRLLGLGAVTVEVRRPNGVPVANASVRIDRSSFPFDRADGHTDGQGRVRFVNLTEGLAGAIAEEGLTGLKGRASASIVRDAEITIPVTITAAGRVTGRFVSPDGSQFIPFAQAVLSTGGVQAFATTDASGGFEMTAVPIGPFVVEAHDPLTGRLGRTSSELVFEGQTVDVTIRQLPRGSVSGVVLQSDRATLVAAARVDISSGSTVATKLQAVARTDGGFRFDGVPEGPFTLTATDPISGFTGTATGRVNAEGEVVDIHVVLAPFGSLQVSVHDAADAPAGNAAVTITGPASRTAAVNASGTFLFEHLPLGTYAISAVSLGDSGDGGRAQATIDESTLQASSVVRLRGTGQVAVTVVGADGTTPVASATVTLNASAAIGSETPGPTAGTLNGFTDGSGVAHFTRVPVGDFFVRAEAGALGGVTTSTIPAAGASFAVTVRLGASGALAGRVLLPDGQTPAARAIVTLRFQPQSALQSGVLQVTTDLTGAFRFSGIPLGSFTISVFEVVSSGVRNVDGLLQSNGQEVALGDLVLDNSAPRITTIDPADHATNVAPDTAIAVTFTEAMNASSFRTGPNPNVTLLEGNTAVSLSLSLSGDHRTVTVRPNAPLKSATLYTFSIRGGPDGPADESGFNLVDPFVSTFTVRDTIAPIVVSVSPASEARGVLPEATVRIALSEPLLRATLTLRDASGAAIAGTTTLTAGNSAVVFAPQQFLQPNTFYSFTLSNVADVAGNGLAVPLTGRFFTVDTLAPIVTALQIAGTLRAGTPIGVQAIVSGDDVARVEFRTSEGLAQSATAAPFTASFSLPADRSSTTLSAVAVDTSGNRSNVFEQVVSIQSNAAPTVELINVTGGTDVRQGQTLTFEVHAADDASLSQVLFSSVGAVALSTARPVTAGQTSFVTTFEVPVPTSAASGTALTVQAAAIDSAGLPSTPASLTFTVRDGNKPGLIVVSPVNNAVVPAGQPVSVVVDASDDLALASVTLICSPTASGCESRGVTGLSTHQTFTVAVPASLQAPLTLSLSVLVTDAAGNTTSDGRILQIADGLKPALAALQTVSGTTRVAAGQNALLRAPVSDNVGVTALVFATDGALVASGTVSVAPPVVSGTADFAVAVPSSVANGATFTVHLRARDAAGNLSDEATLQLTVGDTVPPVAEFVSPAAGAPFNPGQTIAVRVRATDDVAVSRISLSAAGGVTFSDSVQINPSVTPAEATFNIPVPAATPAGTVTFTAQATDVSGVVSVQVQRVVNVADVAAPQVSIASPANDAAIDPRSPLPVTINATDAVGVTAVSFTAAGAASSSETRTVTPASPSRQEGFSVTFSPLPAAGGTLTLNATATDAAGNSGTAATISVRVLDVVAPDVTSTDPANAATHVDPTTNPLITFSEPMDRSTLTSANLQLRRGNTVLPATVVVTTGDTSVTLVPQAALAPNAAVTIVVSTGVRDAAGNALGVERQFTFTTASPDAVPPTVSAINPADQATDVSLATPIVVTFSEAVDPATVTGTSFLVRIGADAVAGVVTLQNGNTQVRFTPAQPFAADTQVTTQLTDAITDRFGNALAAADGSALTAPLTFTFTTGRFSLTSPSADVIENTTLTLEARGAGSLGIASVLFTVNGQALPVAGAAPFIATLNVGSAAATPTLTIVASARNSSGVEIARDQKTVNVVVGLTVRPGLSGVPVGQQGTLRFSLSSAQPEDLSIALTAGNPALVSFPVNPVFLPAGATQVDAVITGVAQGATAVVGRSSHGDAGAVVAVSPLLPGSTQQTFALQVGVAVPQPPAGAFVALQPAGTQTFTIDVLTTPASGPVPVSVVSTNSAVVTGSADAIAAGSRSVSVQIAAGANGVATLIVRAGDRVIAITVFVGPPPADAVPILVAAPIGTAILNPPSAGQIVTNGGRQTVVVIPLLSSPAAGPTAVSVTSTAPGVATATATGIQAGQLSTELTINSIADGVATLVLRAGNDVRAVTVFVGAPPQGQAPIALADPVGMSIIALPTIGKAFAPAAATRTVTITLFDQPVTGDTTVTITSSDPSIVSAVSPVIVHAGQQSIDLTLTTGANGLVTLTIEGGGLRRQLLIESGNDPVPSTTQPIVAAPVGVSLQANGSSGRLVGPKDVVTSGSIVVPLLPAPAAATVAVHVTSSNPQVALVAGAASADVTMNAGDQVVSIPIVTTGVEGTAVITFEFGGQKRELLVIVGTPAPSQLPVITAPAVGIRIGG